MASNKGRKSSKPSNPQSKAAKRSAHKVYRAAWLADSAPHDELKPGHYLPPHPALTEITCPDCGATWNAPTKHRRPGVSGQLDHADTCPIGKGYADAADDDREWFAANPEATERVRPPTMPELQAVMLTTGQALPDMPNGGRLEPGGEVVVTKLGNQLRQRDFSGTILLVAPVLSTADGLHPDEFDETGQLWFREHLGPSRLDEGQS